MARELFAHSTTGRISLDERFSNLSSLPKYAVNSAPSFNRAIYPKRVEIKEDTIRQPLSLRLGRVSAKNRLSMPIKNYLQPVRNPILRRTRQNTIRNTIRKGRGKFVKNNRKTKNYRGKVQNHKNMGRKIKQNSKAHSINNLDMELDSYMSTSRGQLDKDLERYMHADKNVIQLKK